MSHHERLPRHGSGATPARRPPPAAPRPRWLRDAAARRSIFEARSGSPARAPRPRPALEAPNAFDQRVHAGAIVRLRHEQIGPHRQEEVADILRAVVDLVLIADLAAVIGARDHAAENVHQHGEARALSRRSAAPRRRARPGRWSAGPRVERVAERIDSRAARRGGSFRAPPPPATCRGGRADAARRRAGGEGLVPSSACARPMAAWRESVAEHERDQRGLERLQHIGGGHAEMGAAADRDPPIPYSRAIAIASCMARVPTTKPNPFCPSSAAATGVTRLGSSTGRGLIRPRRRRSR